ncbi:MAG: hypothetical protein ACI9YO_002290 [Gammaproteobacteria bacterium]|jgi:hypothetical protein
MPLFSANRARKVVFFLRHDDPCMSYRIPGRFMLYIKKEISPMTLLRSAAQKDKTLPPSRSNEPGYSYFDRSSLMESLAYGIGTLIASVGPVLMGMGIMTWLVIFVGIDMGILIICCLLGAWKSLRAPTRKLRRTG